MHDDILEHLRFMQEIGVAGTSRDPRWRRRAEDGQAGEGGAERSEPVETRRVEAVPGSEAGGAPIEPASMGDPGPSRVARGSLEAVRAELGECTRCKLHALGRRQIVFGVGNPNADLMFVGEAPGQDEDRQGVPFVGRAGQLLTKIIESIGLTRDDVYIANVIKCRPPKNRNPEPDEVEQCEPFLFGQVDAIQPKVIVALGKFAAQALVRSADPISRLRGRVYDYRGARLVPTFHPAYLLRNPSSKRDVWEDMKKVRIMLQEA